MTPETRGYQVEMIDRFNTAVIGGFQRLLLVLPTGGGKTVIAEIVAAVEAGSVLFIAHRRELITQTRDRLLDVGTIPEFCWQDSY
jgi:superfamily II DNA or RNA helicase